MRRYSELEVREKVEIALGMLLKNDAFLLEHDVNERSISHKLADYLQQIFPDYNVDCEYNRVGSLTVDEEYFNKKLRLYKNTKCLGGETVYPDVIIHKRGIKNNLLAIEIKKISNKNCLMDDYKKILGFLTNNDFKYQFGLFLQLARNRVTVFDLYGNNNADLRILKKKTHEK
ncbi:MAG: hypothetical protein NT066_06995 [Candidatus Omnitrophica bacterium]|nr:hypothetical protein [Candidatus Omnitrophota bacterium]